MGIEVELAVLLAISVIGQSTFARFEIETPAIRKIVKWFVIIGLTLLLYRFVGHWALLLPVALGAAGTTVHFIWCRRNGIDPVRATPARKYYELRGWTWPDGAEEPTLRVGRRVRTSPIACDMTALSPAERRRYDTLRRLVLDAVEDVKSTPDRFNLLLRGATAADIAEWMSLEHRCCPFLTLQLALEDDGTTWVGIGGSTAIKAFVEDEFKGWFVRRGGTPA